MKQTTIERLDQLTCRFHCASATMHTVFTYLNEKDGQIDVKDLDSIYGCICLVDNIMNELDDIETDVLKESVEVENDKTPA